MTTNNIFKEYESTFMDESVLKNFWGSPDPSTFPIEEKIDYRYETTKKIFSQKQIGNYLFTLEGSNYGPASDQGWEYFKVTINTLPGNYEVFCKSHMNIIVASTIYEDKIDKYNSISKHTTISNKKEVVKKNRSTETVLVKCYSDSTLAYAKSISLSKEGYEIIIKSRGSQFCVYKKVV